MYQQITLIGNLGRDPGNAVHGLWRARNDLQRCGQPQLDGTRWSTARKDRLVPRDSLAQAGRNDQSVSDQRQQGAGGW